MNIEKLKKYNHPDSNPNLTGFQRFAWYVCVAPFFIFMISAGVALLIYFTGNDNKSINLSNVGFGILIALSSVCFSYFKILQSDNYVKLHHDIQKSGEMFLISAVAFIMSSALKYSWTVMEPNSFLLNWFGFVIRISYKIMFLTAEVICIVGLGKLIDVLYIRMTTCVK